MLNVLRMKILIVSDSFNVSLFTFLKENRIVTNDGYWAHLYPRFDTGCSFRFYKNSKLFFLEFFSTFTHEQIHFSYKIIRNELFFFFFLFLSKRSTILHILAQIIAIEKKELRVRSDMFIARFYENEFTIFLFFNIAFIYIYENGNVIRRFLFSFVFF